MQTENSPTPSDEDTTFRHIAFGTALLVAFILVCAAFYYGHNVGFDIKKEEDPRDALGTLGDFFGGILNPVVSCAGFIGLLYTIRLQIRFANAQERKALEDREQRTKEHFEAVFFNLITFMIRAKDQVSNHAFGDGRVDGTMAINRLYGALEQFVLDLTPLNTKEEFIKGVNAVRADCGIDSDPFFAAINNLFAYVHHAPDVVNKRFYGHLARSQLTGVDKVVMLILVAAQPSGNFLRNYMKQFHVLDDLHFKGNFVIVQGYFDEADQIGKNEDANEALNR